MRYLPILFCFFLLQCNPKKEKADVAKLPETVAGADGQQGTEEAPAPAVDAAPEIKKIDFDTSVWEEVVRLAPSIRLDLRYATDNNFVKTKMYDCPRCFLRPDVARAVIAAHKILQKKGLGLKMYDCYRPRPIQWKLWKKVPDPRYVADPRKGSMHNRGMAVDLTIVDSLGKELDMGTDFDFFGREAYHSYAGHSDEVTDNRVLLLETMEEQGFRPTSTEWWHYSYKPKKYELADWLWPCK
ncbi:MAG TPA: hypothetical protein ENJ95_18395 [Bacteroidetes bacterium]|nr:hypothetical protein [Bacteroidota bacterium]